MSEGREGGGRARRRPHLPLVHRHIQKIQGPLSLGHAYYRNRRGFIVGFTKGGETSAAPSVRVSALDVKFHRSSLRPGPRKLMARASAAMPTTPSLGTCGEVNSAAMAPIPKLSADETER